jgi:large subunit ribosomal protein L29
MAILRKKEIKKMSSDELDKKISELKLELAKEKANISIGATVTSPGRIREIKKTIARIETIRREAKSAGGKGK